MSPQEVAKVGYEGLMDEELFVIPGAANKAMIAARRVMPVNAQAKLNEKMNTDVPPEDRRTSAAKRKPSR